MKDLVYRLTVAVGAFLVWRLERLIAWGSRVGNPAFFRHEQFAWVAAVDAQWRRIREELEVVLRRREDLPNFQDISRGQVGLTNDDRWKTFFFYAYGFQAPQICVRCPETTRILAQIPGMKTAFFSILSPGKHIPRHRGPYKGVIRYHLGLIVPEPKERCRIQVGDEIRHWEEGRSLIFDDTYPHQVWNDTDGLRAVLFVDFVRPLRFPANVLNGIILKLIAWSPFVQDGVANYKRWEATFDRMGAELPRAP